MIGADVPRAETSTTVMAVEAKVGLVGHVTSLRAGALDLLQDMTRRGLPADAELSAAVAGMQRVANELGAVERALDRAEPAVRRLPTTPPLSQDAAIVLGLAATAVPFAPTLYEEAERWLRVLRVHGRVGAAMQSLGIVEAPLETPAQPRHARAERRPGHTTIRMVADCAGRLALKRGAEVAGTLELLFAVLELYGDAFERALLARGTSRDELLDRLAEADRDRVST
jgi:hypothetical protein